MNAEFNWWLLIVGLAVGGGLVWFVLFDARRDDDAATTDERRTEAGWIASVLAAEGELVSGRTTERVLELHATYLATRDSADRHVDPAEPPDDQEGDEPDAAASA